MKVNVKIDSELLKEMFEERVKFWRSGDKAETYSAYYDDLIDSGCMEGIDLNIHHIVDNDIVNFLDYYATKEDAKADGYYDIDGRIVFECDKGILIKA